MRDEDDANDDTKHGHSQAQLAGTGGTEERHG
jgi:hypothetical protein